MHLHKKVCCLKKFTHLCVIKKSLFITNNSKRIKGILEFYSYHCSVVLKFFHVLSFNYIFFFVANYILYILEK